MDLSATEWQTLSKLLDLVLDLPAAERTAWLASRSDIPDRIREGLQGLLAEHAATESGLALPSLPHYATGSDPAPVTDLMPDDQVGPYRLLRELGRGGMGSVWLAERSDGSLKRQVALKLPHSNLPRRQLVDRFSRERDILAGLVHPNIARLYDAGVSQEGRPYLALEYVEGQPLLDYCRERRAGLRTRLELFLQVLAAVQHAHAQLVVHRDLKPANILVTPDGQVRLLDFGIAKLVTEGEIAETELTQMGGRIMTLRYAAPEQILGQPLGTGADIYALGVVLCELLAGALPYRLKRDSRGALEEAIIDSEPTLPSQLFEESAQPYRAGALKGDLDTIVLKALKKAPVDRYATAAAFADDLKRYLKGEPVAARPDSAWYRTRKFLSRRRWAVAATAAVVVALGIGLGVSIWQAEVARREARTALAVKEFMRDIFVANSSQQPDPRQARLTTARQLLDLGADRLGVSLQDAPEAKSEMLLMMSELYQQLGLFEKAAGFAEQRVSLVRSLHGAGSRQLVEALLQGTMTLRLAAIDHPGQRAMLDEAGAILDRRGELASEARGVFLVLAADYFVDHDFARALDYAQRSMALVRLGDQGDLPVAAVRVAQIEMLAGRCDRARVAADEGIAVAKRLIAVAKPGNGGYMAMPPLLDALGLAERCLGNAESAERHLRQALDASRQTFGDADLETFRIRAALADLLLAAGQREEGARELNEAVTGLSGHPAEDASRLHFRALATTGRAQMRAGLGDAALASLSAAVALRTGIDASPVLAAVLADRAAAFKGLGRLAEAEQDARRSRDMRARAGLGTTAR